jgi:hypothetical protein
MLLSVKALCYDEKVSIIQKRTAKTNYTTPKKSGNITGTAWTETGIYFTDSRYAGSTSPHISVGLPCGISAGQIFVQK